MIYEIVKSVLGPHGRWLLSLLIDYQLVISVLIVASYLLYRIYKS